MHAWSAAPNSVNMKKRSIQAIPIAIIGAGNLATNLTKALYKKGFKIVQIYSRTEEAARKLATDVEAEWTTNINRITHHAEVYIVALTDSALTELTPQLIADREHGLWVHTAGGISMDLLAPYAQRCGVFYPMQTFSKKREVDFEQLSIFIEANTEGDAELLTAVAASLTKKVYEINSEQRLRLHLAAVFACNFVNHMYDLSAEILADAGVAFDAMLPLIDETARKVHDMLPHDAQTGPAVRFDKETMNKHLGMLDKKVYAREIYRMVSQSIAGKRKS